MTVNEIFVTILKLASVPLLVLLNGFFVAAEFALVKVRDTQLETLVFTGYRRARVARRIVRNLDAALSATQLGITLASLGLGWVGKPVFATLLAPLIGFLKIEPSQADWLAFAVGFTIITFLHIVVGELAPKSLAIKSRCRLRCGLHNLCRASTSSSIRSSGCSTMRPFGCCAVVGFSRPARPS